MLDVGEVLMDFRVLGELEVLSNGDSIELGSPRQRALLARLLVSANHLLTADRLADDLWQGNPPEGARHTLHVYVSRLRRALGTEGSRLEHRAAGYVFHVELEELDAARFEALATEGRAALSRHDAVTASALFTQALSLWRGAALEEFADDDFARNEAVRLEELRLDTTEQLAWAELELGHHEEIIEQLRHATSQNPLRETCWEQMMLALYRTGRQAEALRAYQSARAILAKELGIEPGPALRQMEERILAQDPSIDSSQRTAPDTPPTRLPLQRTSFIGRESELTRAAELFEASRLLTLTGAPGSGKTRLALRLATDRSNEFPHGTFFVSLAPIGDPRLMMETVAHILDLRKTTGESTLASVSSFLRDRTALLILDNFEHILAAAPDVGVLLDNAPGVRVVVTSRAPLGISGEQVFPVPPLGVPPEEKFPDPAAVARYDAVSLFVTRARAVDPDFALSGANSATVAEITTRLDGLPLAIELAAARIRLLTPSELLDRLVTRLPLLTEGPVDSDNRHRTMRNAIEWSYELLSPEEQSLFRRAAVFRGGFTLEAAAAVTDLFDEAVLEAVAALLAGSLLHRPAHFAAARYTMLEIIREFALEKLTDAGEADGAAHRHADYYLGLAAEMEPLLTRDPSGVAAQRLEAEVGNLRAAIWFATETGRLDLGLDLGYHIWRFWQGSNRIDEGRTWLEGLLASPAASDMARGRGLSAVAGLAYWQADYSGALERYAQALDIYRSRGDTAAEAETLYSMSMAATWLGNLSAGQQLADEALAAFHSLDSEEGVAKATLAQGFVRLRSGDYGSAYAIYSNGHAIAKRLGNQHFAMTLLPGIAACAHHLGNRNEALEVALEAADAAVLARNTNFAVWMLDLIAAILAEVAPADATRLAGAAAGLRDRAGGGMLVDSLGLTNAKDRAAGLLSGEDLDRFWSTGRNMELGEAVAEAHRVRAVASPE